MVELVLPYHARRELFDVKSGPADSVEAEDTNMGC